jgi:hypothetical protein
MITTEKNQSNCKNVESNVLTDFFNLQRRARIQNLSNLTKKLPLRSLTMHGGYHITWGFQALLLKLEKILQQTS